MYICITKRKNMTTTAIETHYEASTATTYASVQITSGATTWAFSKVSGKFNYVSVRKVTANPFGVLGKEFKNWDLAQEAYRQPLVKTAILLAESILK